MKTYLLSFGFILLTLPVPCSAALTLTINASTETLSLTGSDSGNPSVASPHELAWSIGTITADSAVAATSGVDHSAGDFLIASFTASSDHARLLFVYSTSTAATFSGNGNTISYASFSSGAKNYLSSLSNSDSLTLDLGSAANDISISAIPEPTTYAAFMGLIAGTVLLFRNRKSRTAH